MLVESWDFRLHETWNSSHRQSSSQPADRLQTRVKQEQLDLASQLGEDDFKTAAAETYDL